MRAPHRDRRGPLLAALCALLLIPVLAAALPAADYRIEENGTAYTATVELEQAEVYAFAEPGVLGEQVPARVSGIRLAAPNGTGVTYEDLGGSVISFPRGNYTISFAGEIKDSQLQQVYDRAYRANVTVPAVYNVTNPILGGYSQGANVTTLPGGATELTWQSTREVRVRFYDSGRESLLWFFATTWVVVAIVLLFPFLLNRLARGGRP
ncbi:MAG: DUF5803 family protein [Methanospirillum sp.]